MELKKMSRMQREDLILQLNATKRIIERDIAATKAAIRERQQHLDTLQGRLDDVEHSIGYLK